MIKTLEKSGRSEDDAINAALAELGLERDDVSVEILERAKSGFLGFGAVQAKVRVSYEVPDEPIAKAPAKPVAPKPAAAPAKPAAQARESAPAARPAEAKKPKTQPKPAAKCSPQDAQAVETFLKGLLERMGVNANIEITDKPEGGLYVELSGPGMGAIIGRRGETLDAIQHLTNYAVNRGSENHVHVSVDAENYRAKREDSLVHLAEKMAAKVLKYKRSMALEPMNSYERHVIHTALQDYAGVTTGSTGTEPNRRVVISFDRATAPAAPRSDRPKPAPAPAMSGENSGSNSNNKPQSREWA